MKLAGRVAVVTGGSAGLGRAMCEAFAAEGASVVVNYHRSKKRADDTVAALRALGTSGEHSGVRADVSRRAEVEKLFSTVRTRYGRLDILVSNAGTTEHVPFEQLEGLSDKVIDDIWATNVKGPLYCARAALKLMEATQREEGPLWRGCIIIIGSNAVWTQNASNMMYVASKAAVHSLTQSLAKTFGAVARFNAVAPGLNRTELTATSPKKRFERTLALTPLGRLSEPRDVAAVALSLAADMQFVHGQVITVDGGRS